MQRHSKATEAQNVGRIQVLVSFSFFVPSKVTNHKMLQCMCTIFCKNEKKMKEAKTIRKANPVTF